MHTFTACWADAAIDEWRFADAVIRANGCSAHRAFPTSERFQADLDRLVWHQEEPFGSASIFAQWSVMSLAREQRVPVLLDGQGSDEMLGGYEANAALHAHAALQQSVIGGAQRLLALRTHGYALGVRDAARAMFPSAINALYRMRIRREGGRPNGAVFAHRGLAATLAAEYTAGPLQTLLRYEDRNSMAFSIESRCPFMDYRLAEFVFSLPREMLSRGGVLKPLVRTGLAEFLPPEVKNRHRKLGFAAPPFSVDGPGALDTRGSLAWRRSIVRRWRRVFGLRETAE